ncbi:hypothetical protein [Cellulomonas sp. URHD0024]|uniref:hypothetical protein n=1 Tax=Cellulomonas sp. URHD0024 TaxID=1302620 RepID=UPI0004811393|nr:hypothetical protein [Cellulomonas sp. URHD0024]
MDLLDLRHVALTHHGFADGEVARGELVVHTDIVDGSASVFRSLFEAGYRIRSMRLVDDFVGSDDASMALAFETEKSALGRLALKSNSDPRRRAG